MSGAAFRHLLFRSLIHRFRAFGPLRYARITIDKATGRSRGTGFVCFWNVEHANAAIDEAQRVASETGANSVPVSRIFQYSDPLLT